MILDEPTTGLDPQARHLLWERLYQLKRRGATLIITTHYMDEAEQLCDHLVVMDKAKIVAEGSPRQLIDEHSTREVLELRLTDNVRDGLNGKLDGLADRVEELPTASCSTPPTASARSSRSTSARSRSSRRSSAARASRTSSCA